jgi:hypothetical protein
MGTLLFHFAAGTLGSLAVFLVFIRLSGTRSFSAPFGIYFIRIACAALAHFISPWVTPIIVAAHLSVSVGEFAQARNP